MKKILYVLFTMVIIACISSCDGGYPSKPDPDEYPAERLAIIKMTPDIQKYVFVSPIVDSVIVDHRSYYSYSLCYGDGLVLCNPTKGDSAYAEFVQSQFGILGTNPYILLEDGYAIIDWKWRNFHPLSGAWRETAEYEQLDNLYMTTYSTSPYYGNGAIANEEYYLLPIQWDELKNLNTIWRMEDGKIIEKPGLTYIKCSDIEEYGDYNIAIRDIRIKYNTNLWLGIGVEDRLYYTDITIYRNYIKDIENLQSMYVETLNQMIKNKYFEK